MTSVHLDRLTDWLATEVADATGPVAVLAGHFAIFSGGGSAVDLLEEPATAPAGAADMIAFTRRTWRIACDAARRGPRFLLVPLVDDIQFVRPSINDRRSSERLAAALAADYLERTQRLPGYHRREFAAAGLSEDRILRHSESRWLFSERELRISAVRHVRHLLGDGGTRRSGLTANDDGSTVTVTMPEHGEYCLVQAGHTGCAGGFLELLATLHQRGIDKLIAMVPMRCLGQASLGTTLASELFGLPRFSVVNVGISDPGTSGSATIVTGP